MISEPILAALADARADSSQLVFLPLTGMANLAFSLFCMASLSHGFHRCSFCGRLLVLERSSSKCGVLVTTGVIVALAAGAVSGNAGEQVAGRK